MPSLYSVPDLTFRCLPPECNAGLGLCKTRKWRYIREMEELAGKEIMHHPLIVSEARDVGVELCRPMDTSQLIVRRERTAQGCC